MNNVEINICTSSDTDLITKGIVEFNKQQVQFTQDKPFLFPNFKALMDGQFAGGILGKMYCWGCLYIDILFIVPNYRRMGIGCLLLTKMHDYATENNCSLIHLDTFDFQVKGFYEKHGYIVFGILENCSPGHCRFYMKRNLWALKHELVNIGIMYRL